MLPRREPLREFPPGRDRTFKDSKTANPKGCLSPNIYNIRHFALIFVIIPEKLSSGQHKSPKHARSGMQ